MEQRLRVDLGLWFNVPRPRQMLAHVFVPGIAFARAWGMGEEEGREGGPIQARRSYMKNDQS